MSGLELYGSPAFRPAWGKLGELKNHLSKSIWQGFSATAPPHVMAAIEHSFLKADYKMLQSSLNRPNLIYATHCVVKSLKRAQRKMGAVSAVIQTSRSKVSFHLASAISPTLGVGIKQRRTRNVYRPKDEREKLAAHILAWVKQAHANDSIKSIRPPEFGRAPYLVQ
ncbi:hypothetical protein L218DRAFT_1004331 [Marasmius fiardii PR-910]|nr:hypothetical protein L218DRAFT_1004331 [Marasmius fiardii PR-910]